MSLDKNKCVVCKQVLLGCIKKTPSQSSMDIDCSNCGNFSCNNDLKRVVEGSTYDNRAQAVLSHAIRKSSRGNRRQLITTDFADSVIEQNYLPQLTEQFENLMLYLRESLPEAGAKIDLDAENMRAALGCISKNASGWLLRQAHELGLIQGDARDSTEFGLIDSTLSVKGWEKYFQLLAAGSQSKRAFMAMKFGDEELDSVFSAHFKPACAQTGFELLKLDENASAGLIDDRLRVEIKKSRFLVADLSHANNGAYWEAGYAEGLGRPVIYTCRKDVFAHKKKRPHFDTNHYLTITWDRTDPSEAARKLADVIRVTLPGEAKLNDD